MAEYRYQEADALVILLAAVRHVATYGTIDHDTFIVSANLGRELRAALAAYDQAQNSFIPPEVEGERLDPSLEV